METSISRTKPLREPARVNASLNPAKPQVPTEKSPKNPITTKDNRFLDNLSQNKLQEEMKTFLSPDKKGLVNEEQLQFALVNGILSAESKKLGQEFTQSFAKLTASGNGTEDSVKAALEQLIKSGSITVQEANNLNGISFDAAQLDDNLSALYDGKGSKNDPTIATASLDEALKKASSLVQSMRTGEIQIKDRELNLPSNSLTSLTPANGSSTSNERNSVSASSSSANNISGAGSKNGFLWKPVSESNGNLVILLPSNLAGKVSHTEVHSSLPPSSESLLERGNFSSNANGGRDHFRFSKPGSAYPDGAYVIAYLRNGDFTSFQIKDSSARNN